MASMSDKVNDLFQRSEWERARQLLEKARDKNPASHWVLTQLGVTYYEQRRYEEARQLFAASLELVDDCPLTLWHLAGALDALGKPARAKRILEWLLECNISPEQDPCWESKEWSDALKADCVYRLGLCFEKQGAKRKAEQCYRQYLNLLLLGIEGVYSTDEVARRIQRLHSSDRNGQAKMELRKAVAATLSASRDAQRRKTRAAAPKSTRELVE
ncbi:MAG: tetratricopeptide repeat protein [Gemmataceae bacterium]|nr:tetratricopeptide repeat protein [Gemmataceae bacterium]